MRLIATVFLTTLSAVFTLVPDAFALQDDRIVVTGSRIAQFQNDQVPSVTIERRADELSIEISIEGDTRDLETRTAEIRQTLERVFRAAARDPLIQLDVEITRQLGEERYQVLRPFSEGMVRSIPIRSGRRPDSSVVVVRATTPIRDDDTRADMRLASLGFVFQFHFLLPEFSARENVMLPMRALRRLSEKAQVARADMLLEQLGLNEHAHKRPDQMSGGQRQRVAIARALANDPKVVLADEPTGNLDTHAGERVLEILRELVDTQRRAVVVVTHDLALAARADRQIRIVDGKIAI